MLGAELYDGDMQINSTSKPQRRPQLDVLNVVYQPARPESGTPFSLWEDQVVNPQPADKVDDFFAEAKGFETKLHPHLLPFVRTRTNSDSKLRGVFNGKLTDSEIEGLEKTHNASIERLAGNIHSVHNLDREGLKTLARHEKVSYISGSPYSLAIWGSDPGPLDLYEAVHSVFSTSRKELGVLGRLSRGFESALGSSLLNDAKGIKARDFEVFLIQEMAIATAKRISPGVSMREFRDQARDNPWHRDLVNLIELTGEYMSRKSGW